MMSSLANARARISPGGGNVDRSPIIGPEVPEQLQDKCRSSSTAEPLTVVPVGVNFWVLEMSLLGI